MIGAVESPQMPPRKVALILDGKVQEMLHTDDRLAAIFLSNPIILEVTDTYTDFPLIGWSYDEESGTIFQQGA